MFLRAIGLLLFLAANAVLVTIWLQMARFFGLFYVGNLAPLGLLSCLWCVWLYYTRYHRHARSKVRRLWGTLCATGLTVLGASALFSGWILLYPHFSPDPPASSTVVILGCQVNSNGTLSEMLRRRLETALFYLEENPQTQCVVSGGQGANEPGPEAVYMKQYLEEKGIDPSRILTEPNSHNTRENLQFTREVLSSQDLPFQVIIVTDGFHQLRSSYLAQTMGMKSTPLSCQTPWYLLPMYLLREQMALIKDVFIQT